MIFFSFDNSETKDGTGAVCTKNKVSELKHFGEIQASTNVVCQNF